MRDKILVIGGYGNVGQTICLELSRSHPNKVIVAGRDPEKARTFAQSASLIPMALDVFAPSATSLPRTLEDIRLVVMCLDQANTDFARECLLCGIDYIDISANYPFLKELKSFHSHAENSHATAVLNVGLAPGLSTLLAARCSKLLSPIDSIDISILLGNGDTHGIAALRWTMDRLFGHTRSPAPKKIDYGKDWGRRTTLQLDFADQWTLRETLNVQNVWTGFSMDSKLYTHLASLLRKHLPEGKLRNHLKSERFARWLVNQKNGSDIFILKVDAYGLYQGRPHSVAYALAGHREGIITGKVAAATVSQLIESHDKKCGVFYIDELFTFEHILKQIQNPNLRIESVELTPLP